MENHADFNDDQPSCPKLTDLSQNPYFLYNDFQNLPNPDTLQDSNHFLAETHRNPFDLTFSGDTSFYNQRVDQQDVSYNDLVRCIHSPVSPHLLVAAEGSEQLWNKGYLLENNWTDQGQGHMDKVPIDDNDYFKSLDNVGDNPMGPELRCSVPECSQDAKFPSESALRKHEAKHSKPYICQVPNCKHTPFGDKGGLDRHTREVHGSGSHRCPITSCKSNVKGFARKYNLLEHQKRCHSSHSQILAPPPTLRQQNDTHESRNTRQASYEGRSSATMATGCGKRLREKLETLYSMRAEMDADIAALKRSLNLLGEDSSS